MYQAESRARLVLAPAGGVGTGGLGIGGLGIGRLVFRALNTVEVGFALVILAIVVAGPTPVRITAAYCVAFAALAVQLIAVRPRLTQLSDQPSRRSRHSGGATASP